MGIEEKAKDRAITQIALENYKRDPSKPWKHPNSLIENADIAKYMKRLSALGFDKTSAINLVEDLRIQRKLLTDQGWE